MSCLGFLAGFIAIIHTIKKFPELKTKQQSFALVGLTPTDVMDVPEDKRDALNFVFKELQTARFNPRDNPEHDHLSAVAREAVTDAFKNNFRLAYD